MYSPRPERRSLTSPVRLDRCPGAFNALQAALGLRVAGPSASLWATEPAGGVQDAFAGDVRGGHGLQSVVVP